MKRLVFQDFTGHYNFSRNAGNSAIGSFLWTMFGGLTQALGWYTGRLLGDKSMSLENSVVELTAFFTGVLVLAGIAGLSIIGFVISLFF